MTEQRRTRARHAPEEPEGKFEDRGCVMAPSCLSCHLPICIYEDPRGPRGAQQRNRDAEVARRFREGWGIAAIAARYQLSQRQVFRILRRLQDEEELPSEA